jgi:hypothetical protein
MRKGIAHHRQVMDEARVEADVRCQVVIATHVNPVVPGVVASLGHAGACEQQAMIVIITA